MSKYPKNQYNFIFTVWNQSWLRKSSGIQKRELRGFCQRFDLRDRCRCLGLVQALEGGFKEGRRGGGGGSVGGGVPDGAIWGGGGWVGGGAQAPVTSPCPPSRMRSRARVTELVEPVLVL